MNVKNYIEAQYRELNGKGQINIEFMGLYQNIKNERLQTIFASLHKLYETLFKTMNDRLPTRNTTAHFRAHDSRELIFAIEISMGLYRTLQKQEEAFEIDPYYLEIIKDCQTFLSKYSGSTIPENREKITIPYEIPIFIPELSHKIVRIENETFSNLKLVGSGSFALIYKYKDDYYDKHFALKKAMKTLTVKELERFRREFEEMRKLSSPYILEVYSYDGAKNQYTMEYMDFSLDDYINRYNNQISLEVRKSISQQILKAFRYLHSKGIFHRDISPKNVLLKKYDDVLIVKISDFGLVKVPNSSMTSMNTEFKGSFNDPALLAEGFDSYSMPHETYALTRILIFVMTGKTTIAEISEPNHKSFIEKGLNPDKSKRFKSVDELFDTYKRLF
jgi:tRNA A-37 threonylcarbamoyl transferase component Bud32